MTVLNWFETAAAGSAFPTEHLSDNKTNSQSARTSHVIDLPDNIATGNLLLVWFSFRDNEAITWPTGWAKVGENLSANNTISIGARIADGTEGSSITITTTGNEGDSYVSARISNHGHTTGNWPDYAGGASYSQDPDPPNLTPAGGADDYLWQCGCATRVNSDFDEPTNYSHDDTNQESWDSGTGMHVASRELNASSENPGAWTRTPGSGSGQNARATIAIWPA